MYIKKIVIKNLRNISNVDVDELPSLVIVAGPNGTGKSTLLEAINIWKQVVGSYGLRQWLGNNDYIKLVRKGSSEALIEVEVIYTKKDVEYLEYCSLQGCIAGTTESSRIRILSNGQVFEDNANSGYLRRLLTYPDRSLYPFAPIFDYYGPHRYMSPRDFTSLNTQALSPSQEQARRIQPSFYIQDKSDNLKDYLYLLNQRDIEWFVAQRDLSGGQGKLDLRNAPDSFEAIRALVAQLLPHLRFTKVEFGDTVKFLFKVSDGPEVDLDELSSGEKAILTLFMEIYRSRPKNSIILIDEPETHLNQSVESRIVPYILRNIVTEDENQVFVVSHSPGVLSSTAEDNLFRITYPRGDANQIQRISSTSERIDALKDIVGDLGIFTTADTFVFLEGTKSSMSFDKRILERLLPDLKGTVTFVPSDNCQVVEVISKKVHQIVQSEIPFGKFYAVRDKDRLSVDEILRIKELVPHLTVWPRCMIENFLLDSSTWEMALEKLGITISEQQIKYAFVIAAENLKDTEASLRMSDHLLSRIQFHDFKDHVNFGVKEKLNRSIEVIQQELAKIDETKIFYNDQVESEIADGSFILNFHGKNLIKETKNVLSITISDEFLIPLIANVMYEMRRVPSDLEETIRNLIALD